MTSASARIDAFKNTYTQSHRLYPYISVPEVILYNFEIHLEPRINKIINVNVSWATCMDDAFFLEMTGKTLVVNGASLKEVGGNVLTGSKLQEEMICRCTNLYMALEHVNKKIIDWPLNYRVKGIFTPDIKVFKSTDLNELQFPYNIDIISLFAHPLHSIHNEHEMYKNIFDTLFYICNKHTDIKNVVFVPLGCDKVGHHDPIRVARMFKKYISIYDMGSVGNIIISCFNPDLSYNNENYNAFKSVF